MLTIFENSFRTEVALEHDFAKYLSAKFIETAREVLRESEKERVSNHELVKKDRESASIHGVCPPKLDFIVVIDVFA